MFNNALLQIGLEKIHLANVYKLVHQVMEMLELMKDLEYVYHHVLKIQLKANKHMHMIVIKDVITLVHKDLGVIQLQKHV